MLYGIDVSHHQAPVSLPWDKIAKDSSFCIVRATYGAGLRDRHCAEHMRRARAAGLQVGLYHFFRPSQPTEDQLAAFRAAAQAAGYRPGDIVPALDVEADPIPKPGENVSPDWEAGVKRMADAFTVEYGSPCIMYITQREFGMLGKPSWLLNHPLWVANYTGAAKPYTPGNQPWLIWQHRVGPYDPHGPGGYFKAGSAELDQNRASSALPISMRVPWGMFPPDVRSEPPLKHQDNDEGWDEATLLSLAAQTATDVVRADAMREMAGLSSEPPGADPEEGGGEV